MSEKFRQILLYAAGFMATAALGCENAASPHNDDHRDEAQVEASEQSAELPLSVQVSPSLLENGTIMLVKATPASSTLGSAAFGEVVSAPQGVAQVGTLVSARVAELVASEGMTVKKGDILVWLDAPEIGLARAAIEQLKAHVLLADQKRERQTKLAQESATSDRAVEEAETAYTIAHAELDAAWTRLRALGGDGSRKDGRIALRSAIDGTVTQRNAVLGSAVLPSQTLFVVSALGQVIVEAHFAESQSQIPKVGTTFVATRRHAEGMTSGGCLVTVESSLERIDAVTRTRVVRLKPSAPCLELLPGAFVDLVPQNTAAEANSSSDSKEVQVPSLAVVDLRNQPSVFVATGKPGQFDVRAVRTGASQGSWTVLLDGLAVNEQVAIQGVLLLKGEVLRELLGGE